MIENWQDELYQLENKQAKGAKRANIRWELKGGKRSKTFFKGPERQNMQNQTISDYILMIYSSNPKDILKLAKKIYEKPYTKEAAATAATIEFLSKIPNRKKISN